MPRQPYASVPFWDFIQSLDPNQGPGSGVDHAGPQPQHFRGGFPFRPGNGPPGSTNEPAADPSSGEFSWGPWWARYSQENGAGGPWWNAEAGRRAGRRGRHGRRDAAAGHDHEAPADDRTGPSDVEMNDEKEKQDSPNTVRDDAPDPAEVAPEEADHPPFPPHGFGGCRRGPGRGGWHHGRRFGPRGTRHGPFAGAFCGPPPPYHGAGDAPPFDFAGMFRGFSEHPFFQNLREQVENQFGNQANRDESDAFTPPVDIFNTETAFVLHVALPGASKDDIGVNWDADSGVLNIAGVIYRPGDEEFLKTLSSGERKIGMFERNVKLPPAGASDKDEVDSVGITAKMEDGILVVHVPKVEKEWTEIRKVDIE